GRPRYADASRRRAPRSLVAVTPCAARAGNRGGASLRAAAPLQRAARVSPLERFAAGRAAGGGGDGVMREHTVTLGSLLLDGGERLTSVAQHVTIYGSPRSDGSNVILVEHALSGAGRALEWRPGIVGENALFDLSRWCVIGINALGGCYGSSGPGSPAAD